jgi:predicted nucleotidyltransferase component of viral defense system
MYWNTVSPLLKDILIDLMTEDLFSPFRLVGGTALSLQVGHRMSVDIDLFSDIEYGSLDFKDFRSYLENKYPYCESRNIDNVSFGTYFEVGYSKQDYIKIDFYYTDEFVHNVVTIDNIRMASPQEIIAMKLEVIVNTKRKKDFWDLHYFLSIYTIDEILSFYTLRYPYNDNVRLKELLVDFGEADFEPDPKCLLNKSWEVIKLDFYEKLNANQ